MCTFEDNQNKRGSHKIDVKGFATHYNCIITL
jgi:hypothetical protein